ncbi:MAG: maleylpyruvate isomerase family mycothiol-dependent enzyme [Actinophytocola sp.]|nr:maleylpyruvate isomerase family mycothiol-dependent enzyme [Actinophytocola sp.]
MEIPEYVAALRDAGERLVSAVERADFDAAVPSCPDWTVRDLVFHTSGVHRWATRHVREALTSPGEAVEPGADPHRDADRRPADDALLDWFREGHAALINAIESAPAELECWSFLPAPSPLVFWARRQTHETTMHGVDVELAADGPTPVDPAVATDGIDELVTGFVVRRSGKLRSDAPVTIALHASDTGVGWLLRVSTEPVVTERVTDLPASGAVGGADVTVRGSAEDVYLALWNRRPLDALATIGDADALRAWPDLVRVRWSR